MPKHIFSSQQTKILTFTQNFPKIETGESFRVVVRRLSLLSGCCQEAVGWLSGKNHHNFEAKIKFGRWFRYHRRAYPTPSVLTPAKFDLHFQIYSFSVVKGVFTLCNITGAGVHTVQRRQRNQPGRRVCTRAMGRDSSESGGDGPRETGRGEKDVPRGEGGSSHPARVSSSRSNGTKTSRSSSKTQPDRSCGTCQK